MAKRALTEDMETESKQKPAECTETKLALTPKKIKTSDPRATIDAVVASVSPTQPEKSNFFDGELTDGEAVVRVVGFEKQQRDTLNEFKEKDLPVTLRNVLIQENKITKKLEVVLKTHSTMELSAVKFEPLDVATVGSKMISLSEVTNQDEYERVSVRAQVFKVEPPETVGSGKKKQEISIGDKSAVANLTLWQGDINTLEVGQSYQFNRVVVRSYRGKRHLSYPPYGASVLKIDDIGEIADDSYELDSEDTLIQSATVIGVHKLEQIYNCFYCKRGNVEPQESTKFGTCAKCNTYQLLKQSNCKITAKLFLESADLKDHVTVRAYGNLLKEITGAEEVTCMALMDSPPFHAKYNEFHVLTSVNRN